MKSQVSNSLRPRHQPARHLILGVAAFLIFACPAPGRANGNEHAKPEVVPPHSKAFGKSLVAWVMAQSQWLFTTPTDQNPSLDGAICRNGASNQSGPVWFLAGGDGVIVRHCMVPVGKALFVPVSGTWCSVLEGSGTTEAELRDCARYWQSLNIVETLEVDGDQVQNLDRYEVETPLFQVVWPPNNLPGFPPGIDSLVTLGKFVILAPLPKGDHTIRRYVLASDGWSSDVTWHLTVH